MKTSFFLLAAALLLSGATASAQSYFTAPTSAELVGDTTPAAPASVLTQILPGGGSVTYFEAESSHDAQHAQFAQLRQTFEAVMPTAVLFEGVDCGTEATETATIAGMGTAGYVRFLAQQYDVPTASLDNETATYEYLRTKTDPEPLKLYYLLQAVQRSLLQGMVMCRALFCEDLSVNEVSPPCSSA